MALSLRPLANITAVFHLMLCQTSLAVALPTNSKVQSRASGLDLSGAAGKIAGGVLALVLVSLVFGLGAALVAVKGSLEWREFRDRNKPDSEQNWTAGKPIEWVETGESDDNFARDKLSNTSPANGQESHDTITPLRKARLTLKSMKPVDFKQLKSGWLHDTNKT